MKEPHYLTEQGYKDLIILQTQYTKVVEQNKQLQFALNAANTAAAANLNLQQRQEKELEDKTAECEELKEQLRKNRELTLEYINSGTKYLKAQDEIEVLIEAALEPQKTTNMSQNA